MGNTHMLAIWARADMLESFADQEDPERELAFALSATDPDDPDTLRWLAVCIEARLAELEVPTVLVKANSHRAREKLFREIGEDNTQALTSMRRETGKGVFRIPAELEERARAIKGIAGFRDGDDLFNCWPKTNRKD